MAGNPLVDQGTLNRVKAAVQFNDHPELNVSASYLGREAIRIALEGEVQVWLPQLTGAVRSPEPYQLCTVTINLLKSQALGAAFKARLEDDPGLGDFTVYPDTTVRGYTYSITNGGVRNAAPGPFDGNDALWVLTLGGIYLVSNSLWN